MKKNIGSIDKVVRILFALVVAALFFTHLISGTVAIILGVLAVVFLLTSLAGICPIYLALGLSTRPKK